MTSIFRPAIYSSDTIQLFLLKMYKKSEIVNKIHLGYERKFAINENLFRNLSKNLMRKSKNQFENFIDYLIAMMGTIFTSPEQKVL